MEYGAQAWLRAQGMGKSQKDDSMLEKQKSVPSFHWIFGPF